jgi:predicted enzyme related to lactoylglutathione lyase
MKGDFVWYELMTTDVEAARAFYSHVVGWGTRDAQMPGMTYWMFTAGETPLAGLMALPDEQRKAGVPPNWMGYAAVEDVDDAAAKVTRLGGAVHLPPTDIPNTGRFAVVADPQGAVFALYTSAPGSDAPPARASEAGRVGWHELYAASQAQVWPFYAELLGWRKKDEMDMGPMGKYVLFGTGGEAFGGMMDKPQGVPMPLWTYYFNVGSIDEAAARVQAKGGSVLHGPQDVPGGGWIVQCRDPQGGHFALLGTR